MPADLADAVRGRAGHAHRRRGRAPTTSSPRSSSWKRRSPAPELQRGLRRGRARRQDLPGRLRPATHRLGVDLLLRPAGAGARRRPTAPPAARLRRPTASRSRARLRPRQARRRPSSSRRSPTPSAATSTSSASSRAPSAATHLVDARDGHKERLGALLKQQGKETKPTTPPCAGDIGAVAKLKEVVTGDTLSPTARLALPGHRVPGAAHVVRRQGQEPRATKTRSSPPCAASPKKTPC